MNREEKEEAFRVNAWSVLDKKWRPVNVEIGGDNSILLLVDDELISLSMVEAVRLRRILKRAIFSLAGIEEREEKQAAGYVH